MRLMILGLIAFISGSLLAAPVKSPLGAAASQTCDLSGTHVPAGYKGHDVVALIKKLEPLAKAKDEFESSKDLAERRARSLQALFADGAATRFCYVTDREGNYDADAETLWLHLFSELDAYRIDAPWRLAWWDAVGYRNRKTSSYSGMNAFGVSRQITKIVQDEYFLAFNGDHAAFFSRDMQGREQQNEHSFPIKMDGTTARAKKANVRFVVQYSLVPPFVASSEFHRRPTLDSPLEKRTTETYLLIRWEMVAAVDTVTGEILKRFDPSNSAGY